MRVVVPGGTGLIGTALVRQLVTGGHDVLVLSRNPDRAPLQGSRLIGWDGVSSVDLIPLLDGADAVVNLVGASLGDRRWSRDRKAVIRDSRLRAGLALKAAIGDSSGGPRTVIQASGIGFYGTHGDELVDETWGPGTDFLARLCVDWEESSAMPAASCRHVVIRSGVVLAARGGALARMLPVFRLGLGARLGSGKQWLPWIHIDDEVAAILHLLSTPISGPFNLTAPEPVTNRAFTAALGRSLRRPAPWVAPAPALRAVLGEMAGMVLDGQRALPRRLVESGFVFRFPEVDGALTNLLRQQPDHTSPPRASDL